MNAVTSASRVTKYVTLGKLGLAILRDLAENYGGSISLEKSPMGGARPGELLR
jgi:signal transduction histidine kinase